LSVCKLKSKLKHISNLKVLKFHLFCMGVDVYVHRFAAVSCRTGDYGMCDSMNLNQFPPPHLPHTPNN
jgi:hypothetical protein